MHGWVSYPLRNHEFCYVVLCFILLSVSSLIGDFFMFWRLIKDFKSDIVFSACFDYDIDTYYI